MGWKRPMDVCCGCGAREGLMLRYILPLERGGRDVETNKVMVCGKCNEKILERERMDRIQAGIDE